MNQQLHHLNNTIDDMLNEYDYNSELLVNAYRNDHEAFTDLKYLVEQLQQIVTLTAPALTFDATLT